jgi:hypothetical protein
MPRKARLAALLLVTALVAVVALRTWGPWTGPSEEALVSYPPDALAGYLPADSAAIVTVNLRRLEEAPLVRGRLGPAVRGLVKRVQTGLDWLGPTGIDPLADLDSLQVLFPARDASRPLLLARGRPDPGRFQVGPGKLEPGVVERHRVYDYKDPEAGPVRLAAVGDTLVVCANPARVADALAYAASPRPTPPADAVLRGLLGRVDRGQAVWLAASLERLGPVGRLENRAVELLVRPVLTHARGIEGGLDVGEDLGAAFTFGARDEAGARQLEEALQSVILLAQGAPLLLRGDRELLPVFALLAAGQARREGDTVTLRCRLREDELPP